MSLKIIVPEVGESITEVTIATWNKADGDMVSMDEILCELESEKATFELPAEAEGKLKIVAQEGDAVKARLVRIRRDRRDRSGRLGSQIRDIVEGERVVATIGVPDDLASD